MGMVPQDVLDKLWDKHELEQWEVEGRVPEPV